MTTETRPPLGDLDQIDDLNLVISGQGGDGSLTVATLLAELLTHRGLSVYTERDVLSRIKGGYAAALLRASREDASQRQPSRQMSTSPARTRNV